MRRYAVLLALSVSGHIVAGTPPLPIFTALGLTVEEIAAVDAGRPVAKVLPWGGPSEVYVFGAIHVNGPPETYLKAARDLRRLSGTPGYLAVGELRPDATVADLNALTFEPDDVKALKNCREGACDVQLPTASIQAFRGGVDFSRPDVAEQANALARPMVLQLLRSYQEGGHHTLGEYRDKQNPARIADQFETMVGRASVLPESDAPSERREVTNAVRDKCRSSRCSTMTSSRSWRQRLRSGGQNSHAITNVEKRVNKGSIPVAHPNQVVVATALHCLARLQLIRKAG